MVRIIAAILAFCLVAGYTADSLAIEPPVQLDWQGFRGNLYQSGDIIIAGQPLTEEAMKKLKAEGVSRIVNLRTPAEMDNRESTPIAEAEIAGKLGLEYHELPAGGPEHPYTPDMVKTFNKIVGESDGTVFLHCNSARRATHLWVAWLSQHEGLSVDEAISLGRQANFGQVPLEGFLSRPMTVQSAPVSD